MPEHKKYNLIALINLFLVLIFMGMLFYIYKNYRSVKVGKSLSCNKCNVIVIDIDILRSDAIDCKNFYSRTPNICDLVAESVDFQNHINHSDMTLPSFISFETSLYPSSHGIWNELYSVDSVPYSFLGNILSDDNYSTAFMGLFQGHNKISTKGFNQTINVPYILHKDFKPKEIYENLVTQKKPFLMYLYIADLHFPYLPIGAGILANSIEPPKGLPRTRDEFDKIYIDYIAKNYKKIFTTRAINENPDLFSDVVENKIKINWLFTEYSNDKTKDTKYLLSDWKATEDTFLKYIDLHNPEHILYLKNNYLSILNLIDSKLAEFIKSVKDDKTNRNIIILRSDHGEEFYEHGNIEHANKLYQELVHTPLFIKVPGVKPGEVSAMTQDVDLMPTILDILGISIPPDAEGVSLVPVLLNNDYLVRDYQISQKGEDQYLVAFRLGDNKLIIKEAEPIELYNLKSDPMESINIIKEQPGFAENLQNKCLKIINPLPKFGFQDHPFPAWIDDKKRQKLKDEGYF